MKPKKCECGCGIDIPAFSTRGKPRRFVTGHYSRVQQRGKNRHSKNVMVECSCGCGTLINSFDDRGRPRNYIKGHIWNKKYESRLEQGRAWRKKNKERCYKSASKWKKNRKIKLIRIKGSKCQDCGLEYSGKNGGLFQFHHIDPSEKLFGLALAKMNRSWEKILNEAKKCTLLCSNCHSLRHSDEF